MLFRRKGGKEEKKLSGAAVAEAAQVRSSRVNKGGGAGGGGSFKEHSKDSELTKSEERGHRGCGTLSVCGGKKKGQTNCPRFKGGEGGGKTKSTTFVWEQQWRSKGNTRGRGSNTRQSLVSQARQKTLSAGGMRQRTNKWRSHPEQGGKDRRKG